jgi:CTP synthase
MNTKYIFVTGGVLSGLGKGITAASIGTILKKCGYKVNIQKCDPYFNVDAGTLNPAEHGEVFVTKDGAETDLDLGHYERFLDIELTNKSSTMSGRIFKKVIDNEREGKYLGKTVQIIPHITNAMCEEIQQAAKGFDIHIVEVGGTVGDYESTAFIEAIRQMKAKLGPNNSLFIHVVYLPFLESSKELKSKPAQNAVRDLREAGIQPDIIMARAEHPVPDNIIKKLSLFTDVDKNAVIPMQTVETVYQIPRYLTDLKLPITIGKALDLKKTKPQLKDWDKLVKSILNTKAKSVNIGIVAKYLDHQDTYFSVVEALQAACWNQNKQLNLTWVNSEKLNDKNAGEILGKFDGIVVPGGFGSRGIEGKISAAKYALKHNLPYLGLCLGLQVGAIAATRLDGKPKANSTEFDPKTPDPVIDLMQSQKNIANLGGTMRLGNYQCDLSKNSKATKLYGKNKVFERHRHRYEFNPKYEKSLSNHDIDIVGKNPQTGLAEVIESKSCKFFIASQFHPEFNSRPLKPHPLFLGFIKACLK